MSMNPENIIKGRIAETLVNELLRACGNKVYRFGYESILQNLTQLEQTFQRNTETGKIIRSIPDLVVVSKEGKPFFVEVKFRDKENLNYFIERDLLGIMDRLFDYWNGVLVLVTNEQTYFRVYDKSLYRRTQSQISIDYAAIEKYKEFNVNLSKLQKFNNLVEKYLKIKNSPP